jgi:hypothetical protein
MANENKAPDKIWALRKTMSRPNYAVLELLLIKSPRTTRELYSVLEKKFTRLELNAIQPTHIRTDVGYSLGYKLNPKMKDVIIGVRKFSKIIENAGKV